MASLDYVGTKVQSGTYLRDGTFAVDGNVTSVPPYLEYFCLRYLGIAKIRRSLLL